MSERMQESRFAAVAPRGPSPVPEESGTGASNPAEAGKDPADGGVGIGPAARQLGLHPRTLMAYERIGLVRPARRSRRRVYSRNQLRWLACVQDLNRPGGVGLRGLSVLRRFVPCWAVRHHVEEGADGSRDPLAPENLDRLARAYTGLAPVRCRECGVYKAGHAEAKSAWNARIARQR